ncbi:hypothetical protein AAC387_Pa11g0984 [Persea americana]
MTPFIPSISLNWNKLGFDTFHSNGPSSATTTTNLWCLSKSSHLLSTFVKDFSSQHLSMLLQNSTASLITIITGVYGSTNPSLKKDLWAMLIDSSLTTLPRCVIRNFNGTLCLADKLRICQPTLSSLKAFQTAVLQASLQAYLMWQPGLIELWLIPLGCAISVTPFSTTFPEFLQTTAQSF